MLPVMPMEPTSPMPSRSSGTKAMDTPHLRMAMGSMPHQVLLSGGASVLRDVEADAAGGDGIEAGNGLQQLPLAAAGDAGNAQNLAGVGGEADVAAGA